MSKYNNYQINKNLESHDNLDKNLDFEKNNNEHKIDYKENITQNDPNKFDNNTLFTYLNYLSNETNIDTDMNELLVIHYYLDKLDITTRNKLRTVLELFNDIDNIKN